MPITVSSEVNDHATAKWTSAKCYEETKSTVAYEALVTFSVQIPESAKKKEGLAVFTSIFALNILEGSVGASCMYTVARKQELWRPVSTIEDPHFQMYSFSADCDADQTGGWCCSMWGDCDVRAQLVTAFKDGIPFGGSGFDQNGKEPYQVTGANGLAGTSEGTNVGTQRKHSYSSNKKSVSREQLKSEIDRYRLIAVEPEVAHDYYWSTYHKCSSSVERQTWERPPYDGTWVSVQDGKPLSRVVIRAGKPLVSASVAMLQSRSQWQTRLDARATRGVRGRDIGGSPSTAWVPAGQSEVLRRPNPIWDSRID